MHLFQGTVIRVTEDDTLENTGVNENEMYGIFKYILLQFHWKSFYLKENYN